jgi:hypothetical protein
MFSLSYRLSLSSIFARATQAFQLIFGDFDSKLSIMMEKRESRVIWVEERRWSS